MKTKATLIASIAVLALIAGQTSARAGDEVIAAIGGFIGGMVVGSISSDSHNHHSSVVIETGYGSRGDRHYGRGHNDRRGRQGQHYDRGRRSGDRYSYGRWEFQTVRRWVPGHWSYRQDRCGDRRRVWTRGHHVHTRVRVWVSFGGGHKRSRSHRG